MQHVFSRARCFWAVQFLINSGYATEPTYNAQGELVELNDEDRAYTLEVYNDLLTLDYVQALVPLYISEFQRAILKMKDLLDQGENHTPMYRALSFIYAMFVTWSIGDSYIFDNDENDENDENVHVIHA